MLHDVPVTPGGDVPDASTWCAAPGGMVLGGFLAADPARCERIVGAGFGVAASHRAGDRLCTAAGAAVPVLFG